jgi:hypothetical protein
MSANMWCALYISQSMGDLMTFYPNLGETHFHAVFDALEKLLTRPDLMTESAKHLPTCGMRLLNLWSPQVLHQRYRLDQLLDSAQKKTCGHRAEHLKCSARVDTGTQALRSVF